MVSYENRCRAYAYHSGCDERAMISNCFTVKCCRYCEQYEDCKRNRCENETDKCGMYKATIIGNEDIELAEVESNGAIPAGEPSLFYDCVVKQYDPKTGEEVGQYNTLQECETAVGVSRCQIRRSCIGESKTAGGYAWRYVKVKPAPQKRKKRTSEQYGERCEYCKWLDADRVIRTGHERKFLCTNPRKKRPVYYKMSSYCKGFTPEEDEYAEEFERGEEGC